MGAGAGRRICATKPCRCAELLQFLWRNTSGKALIGGFVHTARGPRRGQSGRMNVRSIPCWILTVMPSAARPSGRTTYPDAPAAHVRCPRPYSPTDTRASPAASRRRRAAACAMGVVVRRWPRRGLTANGMPRLQKQGTLDDGLLLSDHFVDVNGAPAT